MKRISTFSLALTYVGIFLGAGFVSGQELWQFFACFGLWGFGGFLISVVLFYLCNYALLQLVQTTGIGEIGILMTPGNHPRFRLLVSTMQYIFLFGILVIMVAGAAALLHDMTGLSIPISGAIFSVVMLLAAMTDLRSLVTTFSVLVPVTTAGAVILGICILLRHDFHFAAAIGSSSALLPNWWISGFTYAAYNLFGVLGIMVPFAGLISNRTTLRRGLSLGSLILILLAFSMIAAMVVLPESGSSELPTSALAASLSPLLSALFGVLMGLGMFASALGSIMALINQLEQRFSKLPARRKPILILLTILSYFLSLAGFGNLISIVYPIFGYLSIPLLVFLLCNWRKHCLNHTGG